MKAVASCPFYSIRVDEEKNCVFAELSGSWIKRDDVPHFLEDVEQSIRLLKPGFKLFVDATGLQGLLTIDLFSEAERMLMAAGVKKSASLYEAGSIVARAQASVATQETGFNVRRFTDRSEAEHWFNE